MLTNFPNSTRIANVQMLSSNCAKVRTNAGKWISAEPIPGSRAVVLFVGDLLELWTGSYYKAAVSIESV